MYCTKCGWKNADDATHCANCSADLRGQSAAPQQPMQPGQPQQPPSPYQQYPQQNNYQQYPPGYTAQQPGNTLSIIGLVLGIVSMFFCPILFGGAGITLGAIGMTKKEKLGLITIIVSAVCMVIGIVVGMIMGIHQFQNMQKHGFTFPH